MFHILQNEGVKYMINCKKVNIPKTRDPFVNTPLIKAGVDPETGKERYWISTWNANIGCLAVLVSSDGKSRIYRFDKLPDTYHANGGFYSACIEDNDTMWLCGELAMPVRLTLSTGKWEVYNTGTRDALVFSGMALDKKTGKIFASAYTPPYVTAFSFDIKNKKTVSIYEDYTKATTMKGNFENSDGTYSIVLTRNKDIIIKWDPVKESVEEAISIEKASADSLVKTIKDERGRFYIPFMGWLNTLSYKIEDGPQPDEDMLWFAVKGNYAYGSKGGHEEASVYRWDMQTGKVIKLCSIPYTSPICIELTEDEKIVAVSIFGNFYRFNGADGALEISKILDTDSVGRIDCLLRIDENRLLGTPFITQRFWEVNIKENCGFDCGKGAPGGGEILQTWKMKDKIYMASYTQGVLTEYDPCKHPHFPENPRIVAAPPTGMRPVCAADDGTCLYYSCNHHYGILGCVLVKYNTVTGEAQYSDEPLPTQHFRSLFYNKKNNLLIGGTTMESDCRIAAPGSDKCYLAVISPDTLKVIDKCEAPLGTKIITVLGPTNDDQYAVCAIVQSDNKYEAYLSTINPLNLSIENINDMITLPAGFKRCMYSGKPGIYVVHVNNSIEVWNIPECKCILKIVEDKNIYSFFVQDFTIYAVKQKEILIFENCLVDL